MTLIKICGLTRAEDMVKALQLGADMVGLIFDMRSKRYVNVSHAAALASLARSRAKSVAVTVNAADDLLEKIMQDVVPDMLQLHGRESRQRCADILARYEKPVIKSIGIASQDDIIALESYGDVTEWCLAERKYPASEISGGRGLSFDWGLLQNIQTKNRLMLSGGLNAENVAQAIDTARPAAVDVASGVESTPGIKDEEKMAAFIAAVRGRQVKQSAGLSL